MKNSEGSDPDQAFREFMKNNLKADVPSQITSKAQEHLASFRSEQTRESVKPEADGQIDEPARPFNRSRLNWSLWIGVPAAVVVILAIAFSTRIIEGTAYGQAVNALQSARTMSMRVIEIVGNPNLSLESSNTSIPRNLKTIKDSGGIVASFTYKEPGLYRWETSLEDETTVTIFDYTTERGIRTLLNAKTITEMNTNLMPQRSQLGDPIEKFRSLPPRPNESVGRRSINGQNAVGYQIQWDTEHALLWINAKTDQLLEIHTRSDTRDRLTIYSEFKFNEPIDDSLFSLVPPAGFTKKLNVLETIQQRIDKSREEASDEIPAVPSVPVAVTLWLTERKEEAIAILIEDTSFQPGPVEVLRSFRTKESDLPRMSPEELQPLQLEFINVARETKAMCRALRVRISKEEADGRAENAAAWRKIHQGIGRELMKPKYVAILNMVGEAIYKYKLE
jgi:outer membrane lipoprotein-sorting protein